jgi:hypothetical protein
MAISEGKSREHTMNNLYSQILPFEKDLAKDNSALDWFNLTFPPIPTTPPSSEYGFSKNPMLLNNVFFDKLGG